VWNRRRGPVTGAVAGRDGARGRRGRTSPPPARWKASGAGPWPGDKAASGGRLSVEPIRSRLPRRRRGDRTSGRAPAVDGPPGDRGRRHDRGVHCPRRRGRRHAGCGRCPCDAAARRHPAGARETGAGAGHRGAGACHSGAGACRSRAGACHSDRDTLRTEIERRSQTIFREGLARRVQHPLRGLRPVRAARFGGSSSTAHHAVSASDGGKHAAPTRTRPGHGPDVARTCLETSRARTGRSVAVRVASASEAGFRRPGTPPRRPCHGPGLHGRRRSGRAWPRGRSRPRGRPRSSRSRRADPSRRRPEGSRSAGRA